MIKDQNDISLNWEILSHLYIFNILQEIHIHPLRSATLHLGMGQTYIMVYQILHLSLYIMGQKLLTRFRGVTIIKSCSSF